MSVTERLAELGITLPPVAAPLADYVPAVVHGDQVLTAGQLPFVDGTLAVTGKVGEGTGSGALVAPERAAELARQCALNGVAAAAAAAGGPDRLAGVIKAVVYVASAPDFTGQPAVANGASAVLGQIFGESGRHVRSAVGVTALPLDSPVEVELVLAMAEPGPRVIPAGARA